MNKKKRALLSSVISLVLCFSMLLSTTYAWFTDSVTSTNNIIQSGNLDVELEYWDSDAKKWKDVKQETPLFEESTLWEPGHTQVVYLRVANEGTLALKYQLGINIVGESTGTNVKGDPFKLSDSIYMGVKEDLNGETDAYATREDAVKAVEGKSGIISTGYSKSGDMAATADKKYLALVVYMPTTVENEANYKTGTEAPKITLGIKLVATQKDAELDSFGSDYDAGAELPKIEFLGGTATAAVTATAENKVASDVKLQDKQISGTVPAGALLEQGVTEVTLNVTLMEQTTSNVATGKDESMVSVDVHVAGLSKDNKEPVVVTMQGVLVTGLNEGNLDLYHVEQSGTNKMTQKFTAAEVKNHNDFYYDPATGDVTVAMATFSEVALVNEEAKWEGNADHSWYDASKTELTIANADQLWSFSQIVGGMNGKTQDSFAGKTVKLIADINLGDDEENNVEGKIFYPIGYWNSDGTYEKTNKAITSGFYAFEGTFDGNGNTISNFYQNTWEMKGDHDWYDATLQYFRDGMGLFGKVYGGTVKNLIVDNFSCDSEIGTSGVIAAYADSKKGKPAVFENISITNCNPRVYNIGNGGIVGCAGWYSRNESLGNEDYTNAVTFRNITVDQTNKISALWGSWGVSCAGILGQYYPNSSCGIKLENCHVAAIIDVNNDVCSNYQYYWYRYAGMFIGTIRANTKDANGYTVADTTGVTAKDCTYTMGNWNEYWYCEIVANSLASYTHDHQFSRLTNIYDLSEIQSGDTWLKEGHFALLDENRAIVDCYHIFKNSEGKLYRHFHDVADESNPNICETFDLNGDGKLNDLKEDRQRYFIPFNQLLTGLDMGIKANTEFEGIKFVENGTTKSVKKFTATTNTEIPKNGVVNIGDLFTASGNGSISSPTVQVYVSPVGYGSTVGATYSANVADWEKGTLTFSGTGSAKVVITDCFYCTKTVLNVTVGGVATAFEKFATKFDQDFLYRVGNASGSTVALGTMFKAVEGVTIDDSTVGVTFETIAGTADGEYTADTSTWTDGTVQFSGTGIVKVTISALGAEDFDLYLEVVDAKNITSATGSNGTDVVLLNNVTIATDGYANYTNCTLYGNGFTYTIKGGADTYNSKQGHGIIIASGSTLDNLVIVGDIYTTFGMYTSQAGYNAAIDAQNAVIQNCHISNCSTPVRVNGVTIKDTTLYGGSVANILISGGTNILENVTTVNYNDGREVLGFGILVTEGANENTKLVLNGTLTQHNFVKESDKSLVADSTAQTLFAEIFKTDYSDYHFTVTENGESVTYANTTILSMTDKFDASDITNNTGNGYAGATLSYTYGMTTVNGYLYGMKASGNTVDNAYVADNDEHKSNIQGDYLPKFVFDLGDQEITQESSRDRYIEGDASGVNALYQSTDSPLTLDLTTLVTVSKYGDNYTATASCKNPSGVAIGTDETVTLETNGTYTLVFTVIDNIFYDKNGEKLEKSVERTYEVPLVLSIKEPAIKDAVINITSDSITGTYEEYKPYYVTVEGYYLSFDPISVITVTDYDAAGTGTAVDLTSNISTTTVEYVNTTSYAWSGATVTITYTDNRVLTIVLGAPSGLNSPSTANGGKTITVTNGAVKSDGYVGTASTGTWGITSYSFKGNNGSTVVNSAGVTVNFTEPSSGGNTPCVTPDTLVTLTDGTQKEIQHIRVGDEVIAWNFYSGEYEIVPVSLLQAHSTGVQNVLHLYFEDGTELKILGEHGIFDTDLNTFVFVDEDDVGNYVGHSFAKQDGDGFTTVKLTDYEVTTEYTTAYTILSAGHYNVIAEGMFTVTPAHVGDNFFNPFDIGEDMKYDEADVQADIEKYGLYTYEDFDHVLTYEQFVALNLGHFKVSVGKGYVTYEGLVYLIENFINNEDFNI